MLPHTLRVQPPIPRTRIHITNRALEHIRVSPLFACSRLLVCPPPGSTPPPQAMRWRRWASLMLCFSPVPVRGVGWATCLGSQRCEADDGYYCCASSECNLQRKCVSHSQLEGCACPMDQLSSCWSYIGSYKDVEEDSYVVMGIQWGGQCFCGPSLEDATRHGTSSLNSNSNSGSLGCDDFGYDAYCMAVYVIACTPPPSPPPPSPSPPPPSPSPPPACWSYIGSYKDVEEDRAFPVQAHPDITSPQQCTTQCLGLDPSYVVMGIQWGGQCFCGPSLEDATRHGVHSSGCDGFGYDAYCMAVYEIECTPSPPPPSPSPPPPSPSPPPPSPSPPPPSPSPPPPLPSPPPPRPPPPPCVVLISAYIHETHAHPVQCAHGKCILALLPRHVG